MPTAWQTFPVEFGGGLITNISPLQQGLKAPGSARELRNFEPSIEGGYRRIQGYNKYNETTVPVYGEPKVQGSGQTGTTLNLANIFVAPLVGDTFILPGGPTAKVDGAISATTTLVIDNTVGTILAGMLVTGTGISGVVTVASVTNPTTIELSTAQTLNDNVDLTFSTIYTISTSAFDSTNKTASLDISPTLVSSPADQAAVTFINNTNLISGIAYFDSEVVAYRDGAFWSNDTVGTWTLINKPSYGTVLVNGASQTGSTLDIDGLTGVPYQGDTFTIAGVDNVYTVTAEPTVNDLGEATITIAPSLASSPADDAAITWLQSDRASINKVRYDRYNISGTPTIMFVDGVNYPAKYDGTTFTTLNEAPVDLIGSSFVVNFKNQLFFGNNNQVIFTAPYTDDNFTAAAGGGTIGLSEDITGLIVYREQLIVFTRRKIFRLTGNTIADFVLQPITLDIGCVAPDTVQEVGGDVMFMAPDGLRLLGATDRIGDFGLSTASKPIQDIMTNFTSSHTHFASCVIRGKSQYRVFGYASSISQTSSIGILGTQFADQSSQGMAWARLRGIYVYVVDSYYDDDEEELIVFANKDGYVYRMEAGSSFDGANIRASFSTPFFSINDPRIRKTMYKLTTYVDPRGAVSGTATPKYDFDPPNTPTATPISFGNSTTSTAAFYGNSTFGVARYGGKLVNVFTKQIIGSGRTVSIQYIFDGTDPEFSLDAMTLEFATNDRQ